MIKGFPSSPNCTTDSATASRRITDMFSQDEPRNALRIAERDFPICILARNANIWFAVQDGREFTGGITHLNSQLAPTRDSSSRTAGDTSLP
jgi:hypothetical protein